LLLLKPRHISCPDSGTFRTEKVPPFNKRKSKENIYQFFHFHDHDDQVALKMASHALKQLSVDHCVLLAATYASESNLDALRILLRSRSDAFRSELALRVLLTYLPETVDPALYTSLLAQVAGLSQAEDALPTIELDTSSVKELTDSKAHKLAKHLHLLPLDHPSCPAALCDDLTTRFLIHRAHRVADAGILTFVQQLLDPFMDDRPFLKTWFISNVLPLLRLTYEYYPNEAACALEQLEDASGEQAVDMLLSKSLAGKSGESFLARDMQCLVGPWMYGASDRKRRKLSGRKERRLSEYNPDSRRYGNELEEEQSHDQKIAEAQIQWDIALKWLTQAAAEHFPVVAEALETWEGPPDVDLGGYDRNSYMDDELQHKLESRYAQTVFAVVYAAQSGSREAITYAHSLLVRLANLMGFEPPPDLATSVDMLPRTDDQTGILKELTSSALQPDALLEQKHPLTHPATDTFVLLQLFVFSAYMFLELSSPLSIVAVAKVRFQYDADEQLSVITRILHTLTTTSKRDEEDWAGVRLRLIWLWGWALPREEDGDKLGHGIFGKIERSAVEKEILKAFLNTGYYNLIAKTYIQDLDPATDLTINDVEQVIISTALHHYDNASNGNRTRGGVKKAADIIATFKKHFPTSDAFKRCEALLAATHSLSFYSLTLQHGVPFQPVNIRVSSDPVALIEKVLSQNPRSYTKLDDLISIATNLVASGVGQEMHDGAPIRPLTSTQLTIAKRQAERRVTGMAIEAALTEDDFETAYSYVVNRLTTTSSSTTTQDKELDDISWRAALAAGRHKPSSISASTNLSTPPKLRRLEQRMELLSQTLLLAPSNALPEVLNVWRKCEEEMAALQAAESAEEEAFNQRADQGLPGAFVNATAFVQPRREVGRGGREEAPVGLFDVARGAAAAFSRTAFPLRGASVNATEPSEGVHARSPSSIGSDGGLEGEQRVRKRDMLSSAVTGGLASGIGWVIGKS
jgi:hypothetical protein